VNNRLNPPSRTGSSGTTLLLSYSNLISNRSHLIDGVEVANRLRDISKVGAIAQKVAVESLSVSATTCRGFTTLFGEVNPAFAGHEIEAPIGLTSPDSVWLWHINPTMPKDILHPKPAGHDAEATVATETLSAAGEFGCEPALVLDDQYSGEDGARIRLAQCSRGSWRS